MICSGLFFIYAGPWAPLNPGMVWLLTSGVTPPGPRLPDGADAAGSPRPGMVAFREAEFTNADYPSGDPPHLTFAAGSLGRQVVHAVTRKSACLEKGTRICSLDMAKAGRHT